MTITIMEISDGHAAREEEYIANDSTTGGLTMQFFAIITFSYSMADACYV
jgi:hypothetical protein